MAEIYIGTSGYSYKDWKGPFYPEDMADADFLQFYTNNFPFVELNFSYYKMPEAHLLERLVEKTPKHFRFAIKAHQSMTHDTNVYEQKIFSDFCSGISPLIEQKRLSCVLAQFPYSFHYTPDNRRYLAGLCDSLKDIPLALEFRASEWMQDSMVAELEKRNIAFVNVDEPQLPKLLRPSETVTADIAYIRFHGRNKENWWSGTNVSRYDYLYNEDELAGWIERVRVIVQKARVLYITFNNHARAQAVSNAKKFRELLLNAGIQGVV
ncbi:MAG: DUF72 domain-containing protein [Spirochaetales bacterium]|nr:DUF72 domain-containing protein [Spirochaetales bacterium]